MEDDKDVKIVQPSAILDQLDGAQVASSYIEEDQGLHVVFIDGRTLVIAGTFAICILPADKEKLH